MQAEHADDIVREADETLLRYISFGPFTQSSELMTLMKSYIDTSDAHVLFAIIDKATQRVAGTMAYLDTSAKDLITEIGCVLILPSFRRTHVTSHATSLLLSYALSLPEEGGLGLRRVAWMANALNDASVNAAERMGFQREGVLRWHKAFPAGKPVTHERLGKGPKPEHGGRDTMLLSFCIDDWDNGGKEKVQKMLERRK